MRCGVLGCFFIGTESFEKFAILVLKSASLFGDIPIGVEGVDFIEFLLLLGLFIAILGDVVGIGFRGLGGFFTGTKGLEKSGIFFALKLVLLLGDDPVGVDGADLTFSRLIDMLLLLGLLTAIRGGVDS
jgi:hypothetical protein